MGQIISLPFDLLYHTKTFYQGFYYYLIGTGRKQPYETQKEAKTFLPLHPNDSPATILFKQQTRVHLFSLASNFYLYNLPHYRKSTYREDLIDNLRNVAIPGTGIPLSFMARSRWLALPYLLTIYPTVSFIAACHYALTSSSSSSSSAAAATTTTTTTTTDDDDGTTTTAAAAATTSTTKTTSMARRLVDEYARRLLAPDDWFSYWRLNCNIVALHSLFNQSENHKKEYDMENKWNFLKHGMERGVPVSPVLTTPAIVVKHRNEEGGMGIYFYKNATEGGDWIIQERIQNSKWVSSLLPDNAPLSTFRVITCSRAYAMSQGDHNDESTTTTTTATTTTTTTEEQSLPPRNDCIKALSCVFRAGRKGAATDHSSILFDVDVNSGLIRRGTTNSNWYQLGPTAIFTCPWRSRSKNDYHNHPDGDNIIVSGNVIPNMKGIMQLVEQAHYDMCPHVPFAGWDVVLSDDPKLPVCLLEVNLSCNFFRGSFDQKYYLDFIEENLVKLQNQRLAMDKKNIK